MFSGLARAEGQMILILIGVYLSAGQCCQAWFVAEAAAIRRWREWSWVPAGRFLGTSFCLCGLRGFALVRFFAGWSGEER